jgi:hypothetical protein
MELVSYSGLWLALHLLNDAVLTSVIVMLDLRFSR